MVSVGQGVVNASASSIVAWIFVQTEKKYKLLKRQKDECDSLQREYVMLANAMDDPSRTNMAIVFNNEMRELTHDIEDCMERFLPRVSRKEGESRAAHKVRTAWSCHKFANKINRLMKRVERLRKSVIRPPDGGQSSSAATVSPPEPRAYRGVPELHGIEEPKNKILSLIEQTGAEPDRLRVIAIVGFGGSGKTALAKEVYQQASPSFSFSAWVDRCDYNNESDLLKNIINEVWRPRAPQDVLEEANATKLRDSLKDYLKYQRYLIVIDGINKEYWDIIVAAFEDKNRKGSRIIVTTSSNPVAETCYNHKGIKGYVHRMSTLEEEDAMRIALPEMPPPELVQGSEELLKKCGGLPLALVSVARQLRCQSEPTGEFCQTLCHQLGYHLQSDQEFEFQRLRGVLMDNYNSLSNHIVRSCLLYLGIFPMDRPLRRNVLIRRWLAEGYARGNHPTSDLQVAESNFKTFIDQNIVQPVAPSSNATVKMCKTHEIMHVFMLQKSMDEKFLMSFGAHDKEVRHLFVHGRNRTNSRTTKKMDLSRVRSLTVLEDAGDALSDFLKYKLMRVLDLEGCTDVNDGHLERICKLLNLRYLSLGPNVTKVPKEIAQLVMLETLDVSKTKVNVLPVEVIGLPCLIHLIGKFKLQDPDGIEQLLKECRLETLAGFIADGRQGFLQLMDHMKKLSKVKIWCECDAVDMNNHLVETIKKYTEAPMNVGDVRSLSVDFRGLPEGALYALRELSNYGLRPQNKYYLTSLKLHGISSYLPEFVALYRDVTKLSLSTTVTEDLLSALSKMRCLLYLKLTDDNMGSFTVQAGGFQSLRRLRLVLQDTNPTLITIREGALPELVSLQLICERLAGLSGIDISHLQKVKEIVLHPGVAVETRQAWKVAARNHPNMPDVMTIGRFNGPAEAAPGQPGNQPHQAEEAPEPPAVQDAGDDLPNSTPSSLGLTGEEGISVAPEETKLVDAGNSTLQMETIGDISNPTTNYSTEIPVAPEETMKMEITGRVQLCKRNQVLSDGNGDDPHR